MKKFLSMILTVCMLLVVLGSMPVFAYNYAQYSSDFYTDFTGASLNSNGRFVTTNQETGVKEIVVQFNKKDGAVEEGEDPVSGGTHGSTMKITIPETGTAPQVNLRTETVKDDCTYGVSIYVPASGGFSMNLKAGDSWAKQNIMHVKNGVLTFGGTETTSSSKELSAGWYDFRISVDYTSTNMKIHAYVKAADGTLYQDSMEVSDNTGINYLNITTMLGTAAYDLHLDDLSMYYKKDFAVTDNFNRDSVAGTTGAALSFNQEVLVTDSASDFVQLKSGNTDVNAVVTQVAPYGFLKGASMTFDALAADTSYSYELSNLTNLFGEAISTDQVICTMDPTVTLSADYAMYNAAQKASIDANVRNLPADGTQVYAVNGGAETTFTGKNFAVSLRQGLNTVYAAVKAADGTVLASDTIEIIGRGEVQSDTKTTATDFDTNNVADGLGWGRPNSTGKAQKAIDVGGHDNCLMLHSVDTTEDATKINKVESKTKIEATSGIVSYQADYYFADFNTVDTTNTPGIRRNILQVRYAKGTGSYIFTSAMYTDSEGYLRVINYTDTGIETTRVAKLSTETWYTFRTDYDPAKQTADAYMDGVCIARGVKVVPAKHPEYTQLRFLYCTTGLPKDSNGTTIYLDNVTERYVTPNNFTQYESTNYSSGSLSLANGTLTATVKITNAGTTDTVHVIAALYQGNTMVKAVIDKVTTEQDGGISTVPVALSELPNDIATGGYTVRTFVWYGEDEMTPLDVEAVVFQ